jgi:hypothetical protein
MFYLAEKISCHILHTSFRSRVETPSTLFWSTIYLFICMRDSFSFPAVIAEPGEGGNRALVFVVVVCSKLVGHS